MTAPADPTVAQNRAAAPDSSVWVSANAGSGKTKVLTDRVARLLLGGTAPARILCLTYTKAAAAEMQNRLFARLGSWSMLDEAELTAKLQDLGVAPGAIDSETLRRARTLFARALETPGGLKIQTIHSFCAALLRRFPLEAGVSPQFTEMEDRTGKRLRAEIAEDLAERDPTLFDGLARHLSGEDLDALLSEIVRQGDAFEAPPEADRIWRSLGLAPGTTFADIWTAAIGPGDSHLLAEVIPLLEAGSPKDAKAATKLAEVDLSVATPETLKVLEGVLLFGEKTAQPFGPKIDAFPTNATRATLGDRKDALDLLMQRIADARPRRLGLAAAERTLALHGFAHRFLTAYTDRKQAQGLLDFDDLIHRAQALLSDPAVAQWVLFRLDGGIDHILVDEAQDTSPAQWHVIWRLSEEFTAGHGARPETERTVFVVGDEKQSIYSFQGADPDAFGEMRARFDRHLADIGKRLDRTDLHFSFRSAAAILRVVDMTFEGPAARGVSAEITHRAFKSEMPGRVDVWPFLPKSESADPPAWYEPVDTPADDDPGLELARRIAGEIRGMIDRGEQLVEQDRDGPRPRRITPGDVLILVQRRSDLFHEIIRALKSAELPVAGADRLKIGAELAVKDLTALISFLSTQEDDLSLAAALRSPLFGLSEADLFRLAHGRKGYLWESLRAWEDAFPGTLAILRDLRDHAGFQRPFELLERILTRHGGRDRLIARLGAEAEDGIDALLAEALSYERAEVPSLTGFLAWLGSDEVEIKRQMDSAGDQVRVMTVHGAKGLEAPVVILPDTARRPVTVRDQVYRLADGLPAWATSRPDMPPAMAERHAALRARQEDERMRLLYVAMTRAENWLIVCGAGDAGKAPADSWYGLVADGTERAGAVAHDFNGGRGLRFAAGSWPAPAGGPGPARAGGGGPLPEWAHRPAATPPRPAEPRAPSDLGGAKILPGEAEGLSEEAAKRRGRQVHLLLEVLPEHPRADWAEIAARLLSRGIDAATPAELEALLDEVRPILTDPALETLFAADTLAEVSVTAELAELGGQRIMGQIDRLIVGPDRVMAVDFKTNALTPARPEETPEGLLRQMGAYAAALGQVYPDRRVETAILWTRTGVLMPLPHERVIAALGSAPAP